MIAEPGECILYNYLPSPYPSSPSSTTVSSPSSPLLKRTFRVIQWNIERAYKLPQVIQKLQQLSPDIICLQELDIGCARSGNVDSALEIAKAMQMQCVFVAEFYEIPSPLRTAKTQGGGLHGNAILSRFPISSHSTIPHKYEPFNWNRDGDSKREPRIGNRITLVAEIAIPWSSSHRILFYSAHLEVFCGIYGRIMQFSEILKYSHSHKKSHPFQVICGDLNTFGHSIARFSRSVCSDALRWKSVGFSEAEWWNLHILRQFSSPNPFLKRYHSQHLPPSVIANSFNSGFYDPFPPNETTLSFWWGMFKGKLDWILVRGIAVIFRDIDNTKYSASDHKLLLVDCAFDAIIEKNIVQHAKEMLHSRWKIHAKSHNAQLSTSVTRAIRLKNMAKSKGIWGTVVFFIVAMRWIFMRLIARG